MASTEKGSEDGDKRPSVGSPLTAAVTSMINMDDLTKIMSLQSSMLGRFEKTNAKLDSFNELSAGKLVLTMTKFRAHTNLLIQARADLHSVFRRIRVLKALLAKRHPEAFMAVAELEEDEDDEDEDEDAEVEEEDEKEDDEEDEEEEKEAQEAGSEEKTMKEDTEETDKTDTQEEGTH